ncbi:MAG: DUF1343 domain-containing protein [Bacteroidetes bacterium]|nr:DUF1343 domain-containing protein [Bacteroidota bacterium]
MYSNSENKISLKSYYKKSKISHFIALVFILLVNNWNINAQTITESKFKVKFSEDIKTGAELTDLYLHLLKGKSIAVLANQSSVIDKTHLVDTLLSLGVQVKKVFCPEHGFRGDADAGELVKNYTDKKTGLPIISLYGSNKKPKPADLKGIDIVVFDLQDVGARFYTYISSMHYMMEACAENNVKFMVLDRPNPNGFYVDGPVLEEKYKSFVGMHKVPVVHGMTVAEYACMINEEGWLANGVKTDLTYIKIQGYTHNDLYQLPIKPSPNLSTMEAIYLYPSLCFFEGTIISVGRGTEKPFRVIGHPKLENQTYSFTPKSLPGASKSPLYEGILCNGYDLTENGKNFVVSGPRLNLQWLISTYEDSSDKTLYFNSFFNSLAGTNKLKQQILSGTSEQAIRNCWEPDLIKFKLIRMKYLLYEDFE